MSKNHPPPKDKPAIEQWPDMSVMLPALLGDISVIPEGYDVESYMHALDNIDMDAEEKRQIIAIYYQLCEQLIGFFFGLDPAGAVRKEKKAREYSGACSSNMLSLEHTSQTDFNVTAPEGLPPHMAVTIDKKG